MKNQVLTAMLAFLFLSFAITSCVAPRPERVRPGKARLMFVEAHTDCEDWTNNKSKKAEPFAVTIVGCANSDVIPLGTSCDIPGIGNIIVTRSLGDEDLAECAGKPYLRLCITKHNADGTVNLKASREWANHFNRSNPREQRVIVRDPIFSGLTIACTNPAL